MQIAHACLRMCPPMAPPSATPRSCAPSTGASIAIGMPATHCLRRARSCGRKAVAAPSAGCSPEEGAASETAEAELVGEATLAYVHEAELYPPIRATLEAFWAKERQIEPLAVEITATQGRRRTGGRWTRPDLVSAAVRTYRYLPGKYMEVVTFEVKPFDAIDMTAVYEALAHLRSATHAYVIFHVPDDQDESVKLTIDETCHVGRRHGVGVIVMGDPADWDTWEEKEEARRVEPDPQRLDEFIAAQLSPEAHDRIARALH